MAANWGNLAIRRHNTFPGRASAQHHQHPDKDYPEFDISKRIALIQEVRKRPCLYDLDCDAYRDRMLRQEAWTVIADKLNQTVAQVKNDWKQCREGYMKWKLRKPLDDPGALDYHNVLEFLRPNIVLKSGETMRPAMGIEMKPASRPWTDRDWMRNYKQKKQKCIRYCLNAKGNASKKQGADTEDRHVDIELFFISMCETTKKLPKELQTEIKKKLFEAVMMAEQRSHLQ